MNRIIVGFLSVGIATLVLSCGSKNSTERESGVDTTKTIQQVYMLEIMPTVDGGAYATSLEGGLWYLREGKAVRVGEVDSLNTITSSALLTEKEKALWVQLQDEIRKRKKAEQRVEQLTSDGDGRASN